MNNKIHFLFFIMLFSIVVLTYRDYGITWDEGVQNTYGEKVLNYYKSFGVDKSCNEVENLRFYGPLFDLLVASVTQFIQKSKFEIRHLLNAFAGFLTVLAVYKICLLYAGRELALISSAILILMPRFYGHIFNNPKDIPFACAFSWAMYFLFKSEKKYNHINCLICGVFFGLALSIRVGGLPFLISMLALQILLIFFTNRKSLSFSKVFITLLSAWLVMLLFWPWAHLSPIINPYLAIKEAMNFSYSVPVLFEGSIYPSDKLPRYYLVKYLSITTPIPVLFFAIVGLYFAFQKLKQKKDIIPIVSIFSWLAIPLLAHFVLRPNVYDELRQFLFILPALSIVSGYGVVMFVENMTVSKLIVRALVYPTLIISIIPMYSLHPYQNTYFNSLVGGLSGAGRDYDVDYWLSSYKQAAEWLITKNPQKIIAAGNLLARPCIENYLTKETKALMVFGKVKDEILPDDVDYYVSTTRLGFDKNFPKSPILHIIQREGVPLAVIKGRNE